MTLEENQAILNEFFDWAEQYVGGPITRTTISEGGMWVPKPDDIVPRGSQEYAELFMHFENMVKEAGSKK